MTDLRDRLADTVGITPGDRVLDIVDRTENLPYPDGHFDVATSCFGIMFAEHHQTAADELLRVVRPGGRIGLLVWTPAGFMGRAFARLPVAETWATGVSTAPLWGDEAHVRELFGEEVTDLTIVKGVLQVAPFEAPDVFRRNVPIRRSLIPAPLRYADTCGRRPRLREALDDIAIGLAGNGPMEWEYVVVTATVSVDHAAGATRSV
jgi:SAM-dependent methyltransferase